MVPVPELEALAEAPLTCESMRGTRKRETLMVPAAQVWGVTLYDDVRRGHPAAADRPGLHAAIKLHGVFTISVLPSLCCSAIHYLALVSIHETVKLMRS